MKKAFISIYVLLILLVFGLTITFIYKENETNFDSSQALYNKKVAMYEAESMLNILLAEKNINPSLNDNDLLRAFDHKSSFVITMGNSKAKIHKGNNVKVLSVNAGYQGTRSWAIASYKEDENKKAKILYKRVY